MKVKLSIIRAATLSIKNKRGKTGKDRRERVGIREGRKGQAGNVDGK